MDRCSICSGRYHCVSGDGSRLSKIFVIGERPGQDEEKYGRPFVGQSGREFNEHYLRLAGLCREDIYITNTVKCGADKNKKPTTAEIESCAGYFLPDELSDVQPDLVILMGATACSLIDGLDLEVEHGIPFKGELFGWSGWICAMYHPAAGMHRTELMIPLRDDWSRLGTWLQRPKEHGRGTVVTDYHLVDKPSQIRHYFSIHKNSRIKRKISWALD